MDNHSKTNNMSKVKIYLDDLRIPNDKDWVVVRNYDQFVEQITLHGLENISIISFDHDLGDTAMNEYYTNVAANYTLNYENIHEKTGMDCIKWLVNHYYEKYPERITMEHFDKKKNLFIFPEVYVHSANPIGSANIMGYTNNFLMNEGQPQSCLRIRIPHTVER